MKALLVILLFLSAAVHAAEPAIDEAFLYDYLAGKYILIGKALDGDSTYQGSVEFVSKRDHLDVTRTLNGVTVMGIGRIEYALGADRATVLRVRFKQDGVDYETTYLWRSDLDNYARISGYLYRPGVKTDSPGMEVLFIDHDGRGDAG
jgi:hypothetical protein